MAIESSVNPAVAPAMAEIVKIRKGLKPHPMLEVFKPKGKYFRVWLVYHPHEKQKTRYIIEFEMEARGQMYIWVGEERDIATVEKVTNKGIHWRRYANYLDSKIRTIRGVIPFDRIETVYSEIKPPKTV